MAIAHRSRAFRHRIVAFILFLACFSAIVGVFAWDWVRDILPENVEPALVGRAKCLECHAAHGDAFHGSKHDLAMDRATDASVLGNFENAELTAHGITSRMFRRDGKFFVNTEGPDGKLADFEVKYTFGVHPLQQYMVEFDRAENAPEFELARIQVLPISWDTERKQWFQLAPPDVSEKIEPGDPLHWTGTAFNWNHMCADCHSTHVKKGFDVPSKTYHTTFAEIDVSCEACHGPGGDHVKLATTKWFFWDRRRGYALPNFKQQSAQLEVETCAACHARRQPLVPTPQGGAPFHDGFFLAPLTPETYYCDGQFLDEVYELGSFQQSKMYHKNIRCTDCHDPHTTRLKATGNQLCTSCHAHPPGKYDSPAHHRHQPNSLGSQCVECHMPGRYYMEVDFRRDHSLRIPRPDLSVTLGVPNACSGCHFDLPGMAADRKLATTKYHARVAAAKQGDAHAKRQLAEVDRWAREQVVKWCGQKYLPENHFAPDLDAAWRGEPGAEVRLTKWLRRADTSAIIRGAMLVALDRYGGSAVELRLNMLNEPEPPLRANAAIGLSFLTPRDKLAHFRPLLNDPSRAVRWAATPLLFSIPSSDFTGPERKSLAGCLDEFRTAALLANDRAGSHLQLGDLYLTLRDVDNAERAFRTALHVEPGTAGPAARLAELLDARAADRLPSPQFGQTTTEQQLAEALAKMRQEAKQLRALELKLAQRDAKLAPNLAQVRFRLAMSLFLNGELDQAEVELVAAQKQDPNSLEIIQSLVDLHMRRRNWKDAATWAARLCELRPGQAPLVEQLEQLRSLEKKAQP